MFHRCRVYLVIGLLCGVPGLAGEVVEVERIPRFAEVGVRDLGFGAGGRTWEISEKKGQVLLEAGPDGQPALALESGGSAARRLLLSRGRVEMKGRRYLLTARVLCRGKNARGSVGLRRDGTTSRTRTTRHEEWEEIQAIADTAPFFPGPGHENSSALLRLTASGSGRVLFSNLRLFHIPPYGIHLRYKARAAQTGTVDAAIRTIRRHRNTRHRDSVRHRYFSSVSGAKGLHGVPAGEFSPWIDLRRYLFGTRTSTVTVKLTPSVSGQKVEVLFDFACHVGDPPEENKTEADAFEMMGETPEPEVPGLDEKRPQPAGKAYVFHRETLTSRSGHFTFLLPENRVTPTRFTERPRSIQQDLKRRAAWLTDNLQPPPDGPFRLPIGANVSRLDNLLGPEGIRREFKLLARIGIRSTSRGGASSVFDRVRENIYGRQSYRDRTYAGRLHDGEWHSPYDGNRLRKAMDEKYSALAERLHWKEENSAARHIRVVELADEPGNLPITRADIDAFRTFLKARELTPEELGAHRWEQVLPHGFTREQASDGPADRPELPGPDQAIASETEAEKNPLRAEAPAGEESATETAPRGQERRDLARRRLIYYTRVFRARKTSDFFRTATAAVQRHLPGARTSVNFRSGVRRVLTSETADWFRMGRDQAVTMMWNEDWLNTYGWRRNGIQLVSYYVELMRTAARKHDLPVGGFLMSYWGQAELKSYSALAHGSRYLHYWRYGPSYANYLPYSWSHNHRTVRQIASVCRDVARIEDTLLEARRVPAPVALLYGKADPIWGRSQAENRLVFMALLHDQVPVDILTEAQIEKDDLLQNYRFLYLTDVSVRRRTLGRIADWVRDGGRLWLSGGAGTRDEFDEPCTALTDALGISIEPARGEGKTLSQPEGEPQARVESPFHIQGPGASQTVDFQDGTAAQLVGRAGDGAYAVCAFRPGVRYEATVRPHFNRYHGKGRIQSGWRTERRKWITAFALRNETLRPVTVDRPCVEAILYRHPDRDLLMLINYTGRYTDTPLQVEVRCPQKVRKVKSLRRGPLEFTPTDGRLRFELPLHRTDTVVLEH